MNRGAEFVMGREMMYNVLVTINKTGSVSFRLSQSYRKTKQSGQVVIGETDIYESRRRVCYGKENDVFD